MIVTILRYQFYLTLVLMFFIGSCTVQKRLYNKGFYVQKHSLKANAKNSGELTVFEMDSAIQSNEEVNGIHSTLQEAITTKEDELRPACDTVILINMDTIIGKVAVLNDRWLLLDDCDTVLVNQPSFNRNLLHEIRYADGKVEIINDYSPYNQKLIEDRNSDKKILPIYFIGLALFLLFMIFIGLTIAEIFAFEILYVTIAIGFATVVVNVISTIMHNVKRKPVGKGLSTFQLISSAIVTGVMAILSLFGYLLS